MRTFKRIIRWIIISLVIQGIVLGAFEIYFATGFVPGSAEKYRIILDKNIDGGYSVKLPSSKAADLKVSHDAEYAAYTDGTALVIYSLNDRKEVRRIAVDKATPVFYKWLPDRNILAYSFKQSTTLSTFDVINETTHDYPEMKGIEAGSVIEDVALSAKTNSVYIKIAFPDDTAGIFRYNIMDQLSKIADVGAETVMISGSLRDELVYADSDSPGLLTIRDAVTFETTYASYKTPLSLLGRNADDTVFLGFADGSGNISKILYANTDGLKSGDESTLTPAASLPVNRYKAALNERIYYYDQAAGKVYDLETAGAVTIKGEFLDAIDDFIVSTDSKNIIFTAGLPKD